MNIVPAVPETEALTATPGQEDQAERGDEHARSLASFNPASGEPIGYVPLVGHDALDAAVASAREAQPAWADQPIAERAAFLRELRLLLVAEAEEVARLISVEQGKPLADALAIEVFASTAHLKYLEHEAPSLLAPQRVSARQPLFAGKRHAYHFDPLGVIAIITPWNYPFAIPFIQVATALVAGNAVILKPSPITPLTGQKIADLVRRAGLPPGLLQVIHLDDADAPAIPAHPDLDKIVLTGSTETGRKVMATAAERPTPVLLELGGKDPAFVCADADLDRAGPAIVWYAMANGGQTCVSVEVAYVERPIAEAFTRRVVEEVRRLRVGNPLDPDVEVGPLTTERQREIVEAQIVDAVAGGAQVLIGGRRREGPGYFFEPTVLADVAPGARLLTEETFGPVLPIVVCDSVEEAIRSANASGHGLNASVWSRDLPRARRLARQIRAGAVTINDHAYQWGEPSAAWGGVGLSGFGRTHGPHGLLEMVNIKWVGEDQRRGALEPWWYPYNERVTHLLRNGIRFFYGPIERRPYALVSLLLNPRTYGRVDLIRLITNFRKWL